MSSYRICITALFMFLTIIINGQETYKHTVKRGETFASVAKKYGITEQQLKTANSSSKTCYAGLILTIPKVNVSNKTETVKNKAKTSYSNTTKANNKGKRNVVPNNNVIKKRQTSSSKLRVFEGALLYRNYEYHSNLVRKFSNGMAYNGERTVKIIIKGDLIHIIDLTMHVHNVISSNDKVYVYSDISGKGIVSDSHLLKQYMSSLDPDYSESGLEKTSTLQSTTERVTYKGDVCKVYKGALKTGDAAETDIELWYSDMYKVTTNQKYLFYGLNPGGIVRKGIYSQNGYVPLLGKMHSTMATELIALTEYDVPINDINPPKNIRFEKYVKPSQLTAFYKENTKQLKKQKLYPAKMNTKETQYRIRNQWDFVDEWFAKEFKPQGETITWEKIGENLLNAVQSMAKSSSLQSNDGSNDYDSQENDEDMILLSNLISQCESEIANMENEIAASDRKGKKYHDRNSTMVNIGGKLVKSISRSAPANVGGLDKVERSAMQYTINEFRIRLEWLRKQQQMGKKYISKKEYENYCKHRNAQERINSEWRKENRKISNDYNKRKIYSEYENQLMNLYYSPEIYSASIEKIRSIQAKMKELRQKSTTQKISKSKWEDWDGIPGSM
ncbi:MAG: LysM peptidoglycan-binding domain-containing protein [Prevotella sp.]